MGVKLSDTKRKLIIADYMQTGNMHQTARNQKVGVATVSKLINQHTKSDVWEQIETMKKENASKDIIEYMENKKNDTQRVLDKLLKGIEVKAEDFDKMDLKGLATAYGVILDKQLKILELQRGTGTTEQINKVQELLDKLDKEAQNDIE